MKAKNVISFTIMILFMTLVFEVKAQSQEINIQTTAQCGECKANIEKALLAEKGVRFAELDIKSKQVKVIYNPKKITPDDLRKVISMVGYDADNVPADSAAVSKLKPCCTKDGHMEH